MAEKYVIDSSAIIDLFRWYPPDMEVFKPIWEKIEHLAKTGVLVSHYEVIREIEKKNDAANEWCKNHKEIFFELDKEQIDILEEEVREKYDEEYWRREVSKTGPWADPWIVTLAIQLQKRGEILGLNTEVKIITQENRTKENNIPKIALNFGIESIKLLEFFREVGIK